MAGQPKKRAMIAEIDAMGGSEIICNRISEGETVASIARSLGVGRAMLSKYLNGDPDRRVAVTAAKRMGAAHLADAALELADNVVAESAEISKVREQISVRKWIAGAMDPDTWAPQKNTANVQVNIGAQHLDALRKVQAEVGSDVIEGQVSDV